MISHQTLVGVASVCVVLVMAVLVVEVGLVVALVAQAGILGD